MPNDTTRRAFIAGSAVATVAASLPVAAFAAAPADRRAWDHAMALYKAAEQASGDYDARVFDPAYAGECAFERAHGLIHRLPDGNFNPGYWERRQALAEQYDYRVPDHVTEEHERLIALMCDAEKVVHQTPAPDLAALRWKLDKVTDGGRAFQAWSDDYVAQTMLDIARLLPAGR